MSKAILSTVELCMKPVVDAVGVRFKELTGKDVSSLTLVQKSWMITMVAVASIAIVAAIFTAHWGMFVVSGLFLYQVNQSINLASKNNVLNKLAENSAKSSAITEKQESNLAKQKEIAASFALLRGAYKKVVTEMKTTLNEQASKLDSNIEKQTTVQADQIRSLNTVIESGNALVEDFEKKLAEMNDRSQERDSIFHQTYEAFTRKFEDYVSKLNVEEAAAVQSQLQDSLVRLNEISAEFASKAGNFETLKSQFTTLHKQFEDLLGKVEGLKKQESVALDEIKKLKTQEEELTTRLRDVTGTLSTAADAYSKESEQKMLDKVKSLATTVWDTFLQNATNSGAAESHVSDLSNLRDRFFQTFSKEVNA